MQIKVFSSGLVLLCFMYVGLLLGLSQYTTFPEDPEVS